MSLFKERGKYKCYTCSIAAIYEFEGASDGCDFSFEKESAPCVSREEDADGLCKAVEGIIEVINKIKIDDGSYL